MAIKKAAEAAFSFCCCLRSVPLAQFLDRGELGNGFGQFGLGLGVLELRGLVLQRFLGLLLGVEGLGFVEVLAADGGVGQHGISEVAREPLRTARSHQSGTKAI